jgi:2-oxoisovalerate dehydrogenase E1 component
MNSALQGTDPVIFFESQRIYELGEQFHEGGVPTEYYEIPMGEPDVKRAGKDVTFLTIGATLYRALEAAKTLEAEYGISAEVIDTRSIVPFNYEKVIESVKKTGKIIIVGDAVDRNSVMRDMASNITEMCFDYLDAPPVVFGSRNWITPAFELEKYYFPQADGIIDVISQKLMPIKDRVITYNESEIEHIERSKKGL